MPSEKECSPPFKPPGEEDALLTWKSEVMNRQQLWYLCSRHRFWYSFKTHLPSVCQLFETDCDCLQTGYIVENESEQTLLKVHIAYSLYGNPNEENCDDHVGLTGYNSDQRKVVNDIFNIIKKHMVPKTNVILFAQVFIYVFPKQGDPFQCPVYRIPDPKDCNNYPPKSYWFIDHSCRVYKGWTDYLRNNQLPKGLYCYPVDGIYQGCGSHDDVRVRLTFEKTPACKIIKAVKKTLDVSASVAGLGAGVVSVVGSCATVAPAIVVGGLVTLGVSGVYSIVRSSVDLADRGMHGQSVGLKNRDARTNWISIVGTALGLGAGGGMVRISALAARGKLVSKLATGIVTGLNAGSACVNGIGIVDNTVNLVIKIRTKGKEEVSGLEVVQLVTSVIFFFNSVMTMKTARKVYNEVQANILESYKASLPSEAHRDGFNEIFRNTMAGHSSEEAGRAQVIRGVSYISNVDEAYGAVFQMKKSSPAAELKVTFGNNGIILNGQQLVTESAGLLPNLTSSIGTVPVEASVAGLTNISKETTFFSVFAPAVVSNLHKLLVDLSANSQSINFIIKALKEFCSNIPNGKWILQIITMITDLTKCRSPEDYIRWACFVVNELRIMCEWIKNKLSKLWGRESTEEMEEEGIDDLIPGVLFCAANKHPDEVPELNTNEEVYHFPEHCSWDPEGLLDVEEYHKIAKNVFKVENIDIENIRLRKHKATVFVDGKGVVQILSHTKERLIVVKTIRF